MELIFISIFSIEMNFYLFFINFVVLSSTSVFPRDNLGKLKWDSSLIGQRFELCDFLRSKVLWLAELFYKYDLIIQVSQRLKISAGEYVALTDTTVCGQGSTDTFRVGHWRLRKLVESDSSWIPEGSIWPVDACFWKFQNDTSWIKNKLFSWYLLTLVVK